MVVGYFGTPSNQWAANRAQRLCNHTVLDVAIEQAVSGGKYGEGFLRENFEAEALLDAKTGKTEVHAAGNFSKWKDACETAYVYDGVSKRQKHGRGISKPTSGKRSPVGWRARLTLEQSDYDCDPVDYGRMESKNHNAKMSFANYLRSEAGQRRLNKLVDQGYDLPTAKAVIVEEMGAHEKMGVGKDDDGNWVIAKDVDYDKKVELETAVTGEDGEAMRDDDHGEETTHMFRSADYEGIFRIIEESGAKREMLADYEEGRDGAGKDQESAKRYKQLAAIKESDLGSLVRYVQDYLGIRADEWSFGFSKKVAALATEYLAEGRAIYGDDECAAREYAVSKAKEYLSKKTGDSKKTNSKKTGTGKKGAGNKDGGGDKSGKSEGDGDGEGSDNPESGSGKDGGNKEGGGEEGGGEEGGGTSD